LEESISCFSFRTKFGALKFNVGGGGDGDRLIGDLDKDRETLRRLLPLLECLLLGVLGLLDLDLDLDLDFERRPLAGGEGDLLVYLRFGGEGSFSIGSIIGLGLRDFSRRPAAIWSSFSRFALFFAL
jgi:hypothetical protein